MESAFGWLGHIIEWFGNFIPRVKIVRATHGGIKFRHGKKAIEIKPGICIYWPIVTEVDIFPVARQTHNLPSQVLTTRDGRKVVFDGILVYHVHDLVAAYGAKNWDVSDTINDITMCAVTSVIKSHDFSYLLEHLTDEITKKLTQEARKKLKRYGIRVHLVGVTSFATAIVIKNIGGGGSTVLTHNAE